MEVRNFLREYLNGENKLSSEMKPLLDSAAFRENIYREIQSDFRRDYHFLLRDLFDKEMIYRAQEHDDEGRYSENLYWCALLLYKVGAVEDAGVLWKAKNLDFDTHCGFDIQFLIGAGLEKTIEYLQSKADKDSQNALQYILECRETGDFGYMQSWYECREKYFRNE